MRFLDARIPFASSSENMQLLVYDGPAEESVLYRPKLDEIVCYSLCSLFRIIDSQHNIVLRSVTRLDCTQRFHISSCLTIYHIMAHDS